MDADASNLLEFILTKAFVASAKGLLSDEDIRGLEQQLIAAPESGTIEKGTGGVRKVRIALEGRGKSGGARVVYFYIRPRGQIYLLFVYAKNEKSALTAAERNALHGLSRTLEES